MKIFIIIYLLLGLILSCFGSLSNFTNNEIRSTQFDESKYLNLSKTLFVIILRAFTILLFPIYYYDYYFNKNKLVANDRNTIFKEDGKLYFHKMGGSGELQCKLCNYSEDIISFTHGYRPLPSRGRFGTTGYQCKNCGKFHTIDSNEGESDIINNCECGGRLQRDKPLFCPKCKSQNVGYRLRYLT